MTFLTILEVTEICSFRLVLEGKTGKEVPNSSRLVFLEKILANNFALSDAEDNTSELLNRGGIPDLPLLRTLLAIQIINLINRGWGGVVGISKYLLISVMNEKRDTNV